MVLVLDRIHHRKRDDIREARHAQVHTLVIEQPPHEPDHVVFRFRSLWWLALERGALAAPGCAIFPWLSSLQLQIATERIGSN